LFRSRSHGCSFLLSSRSLRLQHLKILAIYSSSCIQPSSRLCSPIEQFVYSNTPSRDSGECRYKARLYSQLKQRGLPQPALTVIPLTEIRLVSDPSSIPVILKAIISRCFRGLLRYLDQHAYIQPIITRILTTCSGITQSSITTKYICIVINPEQCHQYVYLQLHPSDSRLAMSCRCF
jgi:hypothetical protein